MCSAGGRRGVATRVRPGDARGGRIIVRREPHISATAGGHGGAQEGGTRVSRGRRAGHAGDPVVWGGGPRASPRDGVPRAEEPATMTPRGIPGRDATREPAGRVCHAGSALYGGILVSDGTRATRGKRGRVRGYPGTGEAGPALMGGGARGTRGAGRHGGARAGECGGAYDGEKRVRAGRRPTGARDGVACRSPGRGHG